MKVFVFVMCGDFMLLGWVLIKFISLDYQDFDVYDGVGNEV